MGPAAMRLSSACPVGARSAARPQLPGPAPTSPACTTLKAFLKATSVATGSSQKGMQSKVA